MTTVLCIDRYRRNAELVIDLLAYANGYEGLTAEDGQTGYEMVLAHQPDLIITETWDIPRKDGITLVKELLAAPAFRQVPILIFTVPQGGQDEDERRRAYLNLPYYTKPLHTREFANLIACLLAWAAERAASSEPSHDPTRYPFLFPVTSPTICLTYARAGGARKAQEQRQNAVAVPLYRFTFYALRFQRRGYGLGQDAPGRGRD